MVSFWGATDLIIQWGWEVFTQVQVMLKYLSVPCACERDSSVFDKSGPPAVGALLSASQTVFYLSREFKFWRAASVRALRKTSERATGRSRRKCWSKCPPECSRAQSLPGWSPPWPDTAAAGSGTSPRPLHLNRDKRLKQTGEWGHH